MHKYFTHQAWLALALTMCVSCSYLHGYQHQLQQQKIENNISESRLNGVNEYTSRTPYHKTYEFEFQSSQNSSYALIFYISESSFSKSIIKHRKQADLHRDSIRIDDNKDILSSLNQHLPHADHVVWQQVANYISEEDARDSYQILQEYIRLKIRDL